MGPGGSHRFIAARPIVVTLPGQGPAAPVSTSLAASQTSGNAPLKVDFASLSSGTIQAQLWDFGDGHSSSIENPSHVYSRPGSYSVALTVWGPAGMASEAKTDLIKVSLSIPIPIPIPIPIAIAIAIPIHDFVNYSG